MRSRGRCSTAASMSRSTARRTSRRTRIPGCGSPPTCPGRIRVTPSSSVGTRPIDVWTTCPQGPASGPTARVGRASCSPVDRTCSSTRCMATSTRAWVDSTPARPTRSCWHAPGWIAWAAAIGSPSASRRRWCRRRPARARSPSRSVPTTGPCTTSSARSTTDRPGRRSRPNARSWSRPVVAAGRRSAPSPRSPATRSTCSSVGPIPTAAMRWSCGVPRRSARERTSVGSWPTSCAGPGRRVSS